MANDVFNLIRNERQAARNIPLRFKAVKFLSIFECFSEQDHGILMYPATPTHIGQHIELFCT